MEVPSLIARVDNEWSEVFSAYGTEHLPFKQEDIAEPIAAVVERGDYAEMSVYAVVRLNDGQYGYIEGSCDTTGWDCRSGCSGAVAVSLEELYRLIGDNGAFCLYNVTRDVPVPHAR